MLEWISNNLSLDHVIPSFMRYGKVGVSRDLSCNSAASINRKAAVGGIDRHVSYDDQ